MEEFFVTLHAEALLTGSREYGGYTDKSDWDYMVTTTTAGKLVSEADNHNCKIVSDGGYSEAPLGNLASLKITLPDRTINLIVYEDGDFHDVKRACGELEDILSSEFGYVLRTRKARHGVVEAVFAKHLDIKGAL